MSRISETKNYNLLIVKFLKTSTICHKLITLILSLNVTLKMIEVQLPTYLVSKIFQFFKKLINYLTNCRFNRWMAEKKYLPGIIRSTSCSFPSESTFRPFIVGMTVQIIHRHFNTNFVKLKYWNFIFFLPLSKYDKRMFLTAPYDVFSWWRLELDWELSVTLA